MKLLPSLLLAVALVGCAAVDPCAPYTRPRRKPHRPMKAHRPPCPQVPR